MERAGKLEILYEDEWAVAVHKPSGLLSVGFPGFRGRTAEDELKARYRSHGKVRVFAVHRLDRDTSGVMLFAKSAEARDRFMDGWQEIVSERTYRCVCRRAPRSRELPETGTIDEPIAYNAKNVGFVPRKDDERERAAAERAVTRFRVLERGPALDLVECELETGRKNQIRVHMAHMGHPILGDGVYGTTEDRGADSRVHKGSQPGGMPRAERLALHARVIAFTHPFTGDVKRFEVPEPKDFAKAVRRGAPVEEPVKRESGKPGESGRAPRSGRYANGSKFIPGK